MEVTKGSTILMTRNSKYFGRNSLQQALINHLKTLTIKARRALIACRRENQRYKDKEITKELVAQVNVHIIV